MIIDYNIGGVFIPGPLVLAIVALVAAVMVIRFLSFVGAYRVFVYRPLVEISIFVIIYVLLLQQPSFFGGFFQ